MQHATSTKNGPRAAGKKSDRQPSIDNEERPFVYDIQRKEAKLLPQSSRREKIDKNDWEAINLPKYSRFVAIQASRRNGNTPEVVNVQVATVKMPAKVIMERLVGRRKYIWISNT